MKKKIEYKIDLYQEGLKGKERFILGKNGKNPLFVIGVNPSKANQEESDRTITMVMQYAEKNGNDSFIMLNLYAQVSTNPNDMHAEEKFDQELHKLNIDYIVNILGNYEKIEILAAWGGTIKKRKYLFDCLKDINERIKPFNVKWLKIEKVKETSGKQHPRHPSRGTYNTLIPFDINNYLLQ